MKDDAGPAGVVGHRHGCRTRSLTGSFGKTEISVPRARLQTCAGRTIEWHSKALRVNARLKDEFGGRNVRVRGHAKVLCHLMFGVLALTCDQLMRLII